MAIAGLIFFFISSVTCFYLTKKSIFRGWLIVGSVIVLVIWALHKVSLVLLERSAIYDFGNDNEQGHSIMETINTWNNFDAGLFVLTLIFIYFSLRFRRV